VTELCVEVIHDHDAFLAMGREWDALVERARIDHPFLTHDWVRTWWECFGAGKELYLLGVRSGENLIGLAPLMRTRTRMYGLPVWRLEFIANVHTPRFDIIVAERAGEVYPAILDHLQSHEDDWDVVMLPELAEGSQTESELTRLAESRSLRTGVWVAGASPIIPLVGSFDAFRAKLSSKRRSTLRQRLRRLELLGAVSMDVVTDGERLASALEDGLRIEAASWKGEAGTAIARNADLERFYGLIAERAAASKTLDLLFLKVGDKRIAFGYCLRRGRTIYLLKTGYDPEYAACSPFNALLFFAIESAFHEGLTAIDLLGCDEPWKAAWTDERTERRWLFLYRNTVSAAAIYYMKFVILPWLKRRHSNSAIGEGRGHSEQTAPKVVGAPQ
jgi:CelD/BcsL family acetyltransferase involved in cellulose biosynthesis